LGINLVLLFLTFSSLTILSLLIEERRMAAFSRNQDEWTADLAGLFIQGVLIPAFPFMMVPLLNEFLPMFAGKIRINALVQFIMSFVIVDYLYYWNHRFFHRKHFWLLHRLHHSSRHLDIFATSRNSLITSFLFIYVWAQILGLYLLKDSGAFMLGLGLTFALDLWRHSGIKQPFVIHIFLGWILILPEQHILHHSVTGRTKNYGANLCWWDKLHGTYSAVILPNNNLEKITSKSIWRELLSPWSSK
jgi:sterol desaturase/sphingolipid hydroxylase (fatty acid hydroxylase superfamily)